VKTTSCGAAAAVLGLTVLMAGCGGSGSNNAATPASGMEYFTAITSNLQVISSRVQSVPIKATGAFTDTGYITIGTGKTKVITFHDGTITLVSTNKAAVKQHLDKADCHATEALTGGYYKIVKGTGRYAGITGKGIAAVTFAATLPKTASGTCNTSNTAIPSADKETIVAHGLVKFR
jgi:hypothetical protein